MMPRTPMILGLLVTLAGCSQTVPTRQNPSSAPTDPATASGDPAAPPGEPAAKKTVVTPPVTPAIPDPTPTPSTPKAPSTPTGPRPAADPACADVPAADVAAKMYAWPRRAAAYESWCARHPAPAGFTRVAAAPGTYAHWLRHLPALPVGTPVKDYQGSSLPSATAMTLSVIDLDVGTQDLQQCMDTIIRLRGEWHWWRGTADAVKFRYAGGLYFGYADWRAGLRPEKIAGRTRLEPKAAASSGRKSFEKYLRFMFAMTGTAHNNTEQPVTAAALAPGDFFIEPSPSAAVLGHALIVLDVARDAKGALRAVIAQGYTPARDLHVLRAPDGTAWFALDPAQPVTFPSWGNPFGWNQVMRFRY